MKETAFVLSPRSSAAGFSTQAKELASALAKVLADSGMTIEEVPDQSGKAFAFDAIDSSFRSRISCTWDERATKALVVLVGHGDTTFQGSPNSSIEDLAAKRDKLMTDMCRKVSLALLGIPGISIAQKQPMNKWLLAQLGFLDN